MAVLTMTLGGLAQSPLELLKKTVPDPDRRIHYGTNELQFGELRLPKKAGLHPVVVLLQSRWADRLESGTA
jgi:hypothetical protein